jgi:hypothetical protein
MYQEETTMHTPFRCLLLAAAGICSLISSAANALDVRSWDQKIDDASKRFVVLPAFNSMAALDKETQLVWSRVAFSSATDFQDWRYAKNKCLTTEIGGRFGWRLPTMAELASLVGANGRLPAGHPFAYLPTSSSILYYWSSTSASDTTAYVRALTYNGGYARSKSGNLPILCVRGPSGSGE